MIIVVLLLFFFLIRCRVFLFIGGVEIWAEVIVEDLGFGTYPELAAGSVAQLVFGVKSEVKTSGCN